MKRSGFTLIELIFVILIIGVLAAVAIPKFSNLKQSAEAANAIKILTDAESSVPASFVNKVDLEGNLTVLTLKDFVTINGRNWRYEPNVYTYYTNDGKTAIASLTLEDNRSITSRIDCMKFDDSYTMEKCKRLISDEKSRVVNIAF